MRARKVDSNQEKIVAGLRKCGFTVAVTSGVGEGFPDLVVSRSDKTRLVEIKDPAKPPSKRALTPDQIEFHRKWNDKIIIALTLEDVLNNF